MVKYITKYLGIACLIAASVIVTIIIVTMYQVQFNPDNVEAVSVVRDFLSAQFPLVSTDIKGKSDQFNIDPSARLMVVYFVAAISLVALSAVLNALIRGGLLLLKFPEKSSI